MSNSPLVVHTNLSPNYNPRISKIDTITIHHVAGNLTIETLGNVFKPSARQASSNYGVGTDGRIGMYVEEKNRAWTSGNAANDHRAITIEVSNSTLAPTWEVSDKALQSTIDLCVDICRRNGIPKLLWQDDKSLIGQVDKQNMTIHQWFQSTSCPGPYLKSKMGYIALEANKRLGVISMEAGDKVKIKSTATVYMTGQTIPSTVKGKEYTIQQLGRPSGVSGDGALIKEIVSWIFLKDLEPVAPPQPVCEDCLKYKNQITQLNATINANEIKLKATTENLNSALKSVSVLQGDLINMENEMQQLIDVEKNKVETLNVTIATLNSENADLKDNNIQLKKALDDIVVEKNELSEYLRICREQNQTNLDTIESLRKSEAELNAKVSELNARIAELEKELVVTQTPTIDWKDATWKQLLKQAILNWWKSE